MTEYYNFPVASYTYFHALNRDQERIKFLNNDTYEPVFVYGKQFTTHEVQRRVEQVAPGSVAHKSLRLVLAAAHLQNDVGYIDEYRSINQDHYNAPSSEYVYSILNRTRQHVTPGTSKLWQEICELVGDWTSQRIIWPSDATFNTLRMYFVKYRGYQVTDVDYELPRVIEYNLEASGLARKGWRVALRADGLHARTNHAEKTIILGDNYVPRNAGAKQRIAAHEVYGHALRGVQKTVAEAEGFAILLEQLTHETFKYRRAYRYLAVSLGWGTVRAPMSFRQVHEILWRIMVVNGSYDSERAKMYAFDECYRAFRGGRPDVAGAVYLKDGVYLRANLDMWQKIENDLPSYQEFVDIIEGRQAIL